ncbi:MAG: adenylyltransferase/cytidyltransferase family protein [Candidatus Peribacteraceae bacterium]|jgi:cytidyltransferase-like protein
MRVLVFGTFDGLHPGHRFFLDRAQERGDLTIIVARDKNVKQIKGKLPHHTEDMRRKALQEAYPKAQVLLGDKEDYARPVHTVQPDIILLGYDQQLPPGIREDDLPCVVERIPAYKPEQHKSSLLWKETRR